VKNVEGIKMLELSLELDDTHFIISGNGNRLLTVIPMPGYLRIESEHAYCPGYPRLCSKYEKHLYMDYLSYGIISAWKQQNLPEFIRGGDNPEADTMVKFVKMLFPQFETAWELLWKQAARSEAPIITSINAAIRTISGDIREIHPLVIEKPQLTADLLQYRAAAIALLYIGELSAMKNRDASIDLDRACYWDSEYCDRRLNDMIFNEYFSEFYQDGEEVIHLLENWRDLFANDGASYPVLVETLNQLPIGITPELLCYFPQWRLGRVITDRLELTTVLTYARSHPIDFNGAILAWDQDGFPYASHVDWPQWSQNNQEKIGRLIEAASASEIRQAMAIISKFSGFDLVPEMDDAVTLFVNFFDGYKGNVAGDIGTLAQDVVQWKQSARNAGILYNLIAEVDSPTLNIPKEEAIRFLETSYDVEQATSLFEVNECAIYTVFPFEKHYHFVVNHDQMQAIIIGNDRHQIIYASGVNETPNGAAEWGKEIFKGLGWQLIHLVSGNCGPNDDDTCVQLRDDEIPF
jgi:hypothetical protein